MAKKKGTKAKSRTTAAEGQIKNNADQFVQAPLRSRMFANAIDFMLVGAFSAAPTNMFLGTTHAPSVWNLVIVSGVYGLYEVGGLTIWGKTLGRHWAGLRVRALDNAHTRTGGIGPWRALVRWTLKIYTPFSYLAVASKTFASFAELVQMGGFFLVVGSILYNNDRRGIHDMAAKTMLCISESESKTATTRRSK